MAHKKNVRVWGPYDDVLLYTCSVLHTIRQRRWDDLADIRTHFRPHAEGERILLDRAYTVLGWGAPGDGSYTHDSSTVLATGRGAVPFMVGHGIGQAIGNRSRRSAAAAAAMPRWMPTGGGHLFVSTHGFYLHASNGLHRWEWAAIDGAALASPGLFDLQGRSENGSVHWQLATHAAELLFVLWALVQHPDHPQLASHTWLPLGWAAWAEEHGRTPPGIPVSPSGLPGTPPGQT